MADGDANFVCDPLLDPSSTWVEEEGRFLAFPNPSLESAPKLRQVNADAELLGTVMNYYLPGQQRNVGHFLLLLLEELMDYIISFLLIKVK